MRRAIASRDERLAAVEYARTRLTRSTLLAGDMESPSQIPHAQLTDALFVTYDELKADYDRHVTELLAANNREVERRRAAEAALRLARKPIAAEIDYLVWNYAPGDPARREDVTNPDGLRYLAPFEAALAAIDRVLADA